MDLIANKHITQEILYWKRKNQSTFIMLQNVKEKNHVLEKPKEAFSELLSRKPVGSQRRSSSYSIYEEI